MVSSIRPVSSSPDPISVRHKKELLNRIDDRIDVRVPRVEFFGDHSLKLCLGKIPVFLFCEGEHIHINPVVFGDCVGYYNLLGNVFSDLHSSELDNNLIREHDCSCPLGDD